MPTTSMDSQKTLRYVIEEVFCKEASLLLLIFPIPSNFGWPKGDPVISSYKVALYWVRLLIPLTSSDWQQFSKVLGRRIYERPSTEIL